MYAENERDTALMLLVGEKLEAESYCCVTL
jgi:hypothetical protein